MAEPFDTTGLYEVGRAIGLKCRLAEIDRELGELCPMTRRAGQLHEERVRVVDEIAELVRRTHEAK